MAYISNSGRENMMRIESLIACNIHNILQKENGNENHIYLYNVGELWVAFENSAFQLEQLSDDVDTTVLVRPKNHPFPFVFNTISDTKVRILYQHNQHKDFLQIPATPLDKESFKNWYQDFLTT